MPVFSVHLQKMSFLLRVERKKGRVDTQKEILMYNIIVIIERTDSQI